MAVNVDTEAWQKKAHVFRWKWGVPWMSVCIWLTIAETEMEIPKLGNVNKDNAQVSVLLS